MGTAVIGVFRSRGINPETLPQDARRTREMGRREYPATERGPGVV
jgi:hypothetical protein